MLAFCTKVNESYSRKHECDGSERTLSKCLTHASQTSSYVLMIQLEVLTALNVVKEYSIEALTIRHPSPFKSSKSSQQFCDR